MILNAHERPAAAGVRRRHERARLDSRRGPLCGRRALCSRRAARGEVSTTSVAAPSATTSTSVRAVLAELGEVGNSAHSLRRRPARSRPPLRHRRFEDGARSSAGRGSRQLRGRAGLDHRLVSRQRSRGGVPSSPANTRPGTSAITARRGAARSERRGVLGAGGLLWPPRGAMSCAATRRSSWRRFRRAQCDIARDMAQVRAHVAGAAVASSTAPVSPTSTVPSVTKKARIAPTRSVRRTLRAPSPPWAAKLVHRIDRLRLRWRPGRAVR